MRERLHVNERNDGAAQAIAVFLLGCLSTYCATATTTATTGSGLPNVCMHAMCVRILLVPVRDYV